MPPFSKTVLDQLFRCGFGCQDEQLALFPRTHLEQRDGYECLPFSRDTVLPFRMESADYDSRANALVKIGAGYMTTTCSISTFFDWTRRNAGIDCVNTYYECLIAGAAMRVGFDIDTKKPDCNAPYRDRPDLFLPWIVTRLIAFMRDACGEDVLPEQLYVSASNTHIQSYHILIGHLLLRNQAERDAFADAVGSHFDDIPGVVDPGVYGRNHNIRCLGSRKNVEHRVPLMPVSGVGDMRFADSAEYELWSNIPVETIMDHLWSVIPSGTRPVNSIAAPLAEPINSPAPKRSRGEPHASGVGAHDLVFRVLGETHTKPILSGRKDATRHDMLRPKKGESVRRPCPSGRWHDSNGFNTWVENGQVMYMCLHTACMNDDPRVDKKRVFTLGPATPCAEPPTIREAGGASYRAWASADVPSAMWMEPRPGVCMPRPWEDVRVLEDTFKLRVHVFRGEAGPHGPYLHRWLFGSHDRCPLCREVHCDPFKPYEVRVLVNSPGRRILYAPCRTNGETLAGRAPTADDATFETLLARVNDAADGERLDAAIRVMAYAHDGDEEHYRRVREHREAKVSYSYAGQTVAVRYDKSKGFRLVCTSPLNGKHFEVVTRDRLRGGDTPDFDLTV